MRPVDLIKPPEQVFCSTVDIIASRVVGEIVAQRRPGEFCLEQVDFVQEEDDTRPHKPPTVHYGVKKN